MEKKNCSFHYSHSCSCKCIEAASRPSIHQVKSLLRALVAKKKKRKKRHGALLDVCQSEPIRLYCSWLYQEATAQCWWTMRGPHRPLARWCNCSLTTASWKSINGQVLFLACFVAKTATTVASTLSSLASAQLAGSLLLSESVHVFVFFLKHLERVIFFFLLNPPNVLFLLHYFL